MNDQTQLHPLAKQFVFPSLFVLWAVGRTVCIAIGLLLVLFGCQKPEANPTASIPQPATTATNSQLPTLSTPLPTAIPTIPPTPTPPLAALVNQQPILLSTFEKELARYEQGQIELGLTAGSDGVNHRVLVLDTLIDQMLITQAATLSNILISMEMVAQKLEELKQSVGDDTQFATWLTANQWNEEEFKTALAQEMMTEQLKSQITQDVPYTGLQIHARYIQISDAALAQSLHQQLLAGEDFASLANEHSLDRLTGEHGGDLGFFPANTLLVSEVERVAFALEVGQLSEIISINNPDGNTTYYIIQTLEKEPQRGLTPQQRAVLLQERFESWLAEQRAEADIVRFIDTR